MPLLGKKVFAPTKPLTDIQPNEAVYTIPYTGEKFRHKSEYEERCSMYKEKIWTCQCTGHVNLTYEEAWNSEKAVHKAIQEQFPKCYEKPTLEIVHHATVSLDNLVDQAWLNLQQVLSVGENVCLKIKAGGKTIRGTVVLIDSSGVQANPTSNCSSPSSDKENSSSEGGKEAPPKKWLPPKLLPYKYNIRLEDEDKVINFVPASDLSRAERPPSKELIRLFIRAHTIRAGQTPTSPWVVDREMVQKYKLPSKFADFLLSPAKMAEASKRAEEEITRKRKANKSQERSSKKQKVDKNSKPAKKKKKLDVTKVKKSKKEVLEINSGSSDDEVVLSKVIKKSSSKSNDSDSDSDTPLVKIKLTPKKSSKSAEDSSSSDDEPLIKIGSASKKSQKKKKTVTTNSAKKSPKKKKEKEDASPTKKKRGRPKKTDEKEKKKKSKSKEKGMKQMTLFEVASKKGKTAKSPSKSTPRKMLSPNINITPAIVSQLVKAQSAEDKTKYLALVKKAATSLTATQRNNLPAAVKPDVVQKYEQFKEKQLLAKMTPAEREQYRLKKRQEKKKEMSKRFEDQSLRLTPLPAPKLVSSPDTLPNEVFGDLAMVTELISCYKGLLMPDDDYPIYTDALMKAISSGPSGFTYMSRVLVILLQTLLQDQIADGYKELKVQLSDIPVNPYTASELVRLCLRSTDSQNDDNEEEDYDEEVSQYIIEKLEEKEFYQLDPVDKLAILKGLCLRIMGSYSVQDYMEEKQTQATKLTKQKYAEMREMNEKMKRDKLMKEYNKSEDVTPASSATSLTASSLITSSFYGPTGSGDKADSDSNPGTGEGSGETEEEDNLVTTIRSRRVSAAKVAAEKAKREEEKRKMIEKNLAEYKKQKERETFEKNYREGIEAAKQTLRLTPIGTDRNHNRYWIFNPTTPGLYIEKGWVTEDYSYNVQSEDDEPIAMMLSTPKKSKDVTSPNGTPKKSPAKSPRKTPSTISSVPHHGQNLWFEYDSVKDLDQLVKALHPQGFRESLLKAEICKRYDDITKAINISKRTNLELRDSDGDVEILDGLRRELIDMEVRLRNGGLGGVVDFPKWEANILKSDKLEDFCTALLEVQANVMDKFLKGIMRSLIIPTMTIVTTVVKEVNDNDSEEDVEVREAEKNFKSSTLVQWKESVENCSTFSRFHVLLGMLESCVKWEKSAENAKCKICRKKDNDDRLLLCDECNLAFHMYCLRPALRDVPKGDWYCAACVPHKRPQNFRRVVLDQDDKGVEEEKGLEMEHEDTCAECGGDEDLIVCSTCPRSYHTFCHDPVLRHPPRGHWECMDCKDGGSKKSKQKKKRLRKSVNASYTEEDSDSGDDYKPGHSSKRSVPNSRKIAVNVRRTRTKHKPVLEADDSPPRMSRRAPSELSLCEDILNQLCKHKCSWPFIDPVSKKDVPDYFTIIKHPMDFRTMRNKFLTYSSAQEFVDDLSLVFRNTAQYNKEDTEIYQCMLTLEKLVSQLVNAYLPNHLYSRDVVANGYDDHHGYSSKRRRR